MKKTAVSIAIYTSIHGGGGRHLRFLYRFRLNVFFLKRFRGLSRGPVPVRQWALHPAQLPVRWVR